MVLMWPNVNGQARLTGWRPAILESAMSRVYRLKILWGSIVLFSIIAKLLRCLWLGGVQSNCGWIRAREAKRAISDAQQSQ
jgi:hypothetical protein